MLHFAVMLHFAEEHHSITSPHKLLLKQATFVAHVLLFTLKRNVCSAWLVAIVTSPSLTHWVSRNAMSRSISRLDLKRIFSLYWERQEEGAEVEVR